MLTADIIMNRIKPWETEEQYEKAVELIEDRHREQWKDGKIANSIGRFYAIRGRCFQVSKGTHELPEEAKKISKKYPLPYIPQFFANQKDWESFMEIIQKQIELQQDEALKIIYPDIADSKIRFKKYRIRMKLIFTLYFLFTAIVIAGLIGIVTYLL